MTKQRAEASALSRPLTRRQFLRTSASALAVPHVISPSSMGLAGTVAPSERITIGMIGLGRQTIAYNLPFFLSQPDAQVVALCDVDRYRLDLNDQREIVLYGRKRTWQHGHLANCTRYTDFRELLARDDVDAVMITTPDHWHVNMAIAAIKAGKDVCCEKPLSTCIAEGRLLADTAAKSDRVFRTDSEFRSYEITVRAMELVRNGRIGQLRTIRTSIPITDPALPQQPEMPVPKGLDYDMWLGPAPVAPYTEKRVHPQKSYERPGWYRNTDYCEGVICNWGYHLSTVAQWGNDSERTGPVEIKGHGSFPPADGLWNVIRDFSLEYRYANGVRLLYDSIKPPHVRFEGTEGWVDVVFFKGPEGLKAEPQSLLTTKIGPDEAHFPLKHEKRDFLDCVKTRATPLEDAEVGHRSSSIGQLGHIACRVGETLRWDPDKEQFTNSDEANRLLRRPDGRPPWNVWA